MLDYSQYLNINTLTTLQNCRSDGPEHDEMLFIISHQVYELWFKQILHETDRAIAQLQADQLSATQKTFKRLLKILKTMVSQIDILETMTPLEFLSFRRSLQQASGLQSHQFRAIEFSFGQKSARVLQRFANTDPAVYQTLQQRFAAPSVWDYFLQFLQRQGHAVAAELLNRDVTTPITATNAAQNLLISLYRQQTEIAEFCESLLDFDEGLQEWRYRHVKMVERTIGLKLGTGQTQGVNYLKNTLFTPLFPDLWQVRSQF